MTWGVVAWPVPFGTVDVEWQFDGGGFNSEDALIGTVVPFREGGSGGIAAGCMPSILAGRIGTDLAVGVVADLLWTDLSGNVRWGFTVEGATDFDFLRLEFSSVAQARLYGFSTQTVNATIAGDVAEFLSEFTPAGLWNGGCGRLVQDEPDVLHRVEVSQSPYMAGANTHVELGSRERRTLRWVQVHGAYIHTVLANDPRFQAVAPRGPANENNLLDRAVVEFSRGTELEVSVQGRPRFDAQVVDSDPRVSQYAQRVGQSGRRYDVEIGFEVLL